MTTPTLPNGMPRKAHRIFILQRARQAFTLIELLAVIGILGILSALLLPMIGSFREKTESMTCVSHLRQIGIGLRSYANDSNGMVLPRMLNLYGPDAKPPGDQIAWYQRLYYFGYVTNRDAFYCPSFFPKNSKEAIRINTAGGDTYAIRSWVVPGQSWEPQSEQLKPFTAIETPADFFLVADSVWLSSKSQGYGVTPGITNQKIHLRHQKRANTLFADGHVAAMPGDYFAGLGSGRQAAYGVEKRDFSVWDQKAIEP